MTRPRVNIGFVGFLFGATGMFATMYATQAILPRLGRDFHVSDSTAGLSISVLVVCVGAGAWLWGPSPTGSAGGAPCSSRAPSSRSPSSSPRRRRRSRCCSSRVGCRGCACRGCLIVSLPYVMEAFGRTMGRRAMGYYVFSLTFGGLVGRVGVAELSAVVGWRVALGSLAVLPLWRRS